MASDASELGKGLFGYRRSAVQQIISDRDIMLRQAEGRVRAAESRVAELEGELSSIRERSRRMEEQLERLRSLVEGSPGAVARADEAPADLAFGFGGTTDADTSFGEGSTTDEVPFDATSELDAAAESRVDTGLPIDMPSPDESGATEDATSAQDEALSFVDEGHDAAGETAYDATFGEAAYGTGEAVTYQVPLDDEALAVPDTFDVPASYDASASSEPASYEAEPYSMDLDAAPTDLDAHTGPELDVETGPQLDEYPFAADDAISSAALDQLGEDAEREASFNAAYGAVEEGTFDVPDAANDSWGDEAVEASVTAEGWEPGDGAAMTEAPLALDEEKEELVSQETDADTGADVGAIGSSPHTSEITARFLTEELAGILTAAEESAARIVERAQASTEQQIAEANRLWREVQGEIARFAAWRQEVEPIIEQVREKVEEVREKVEAVPERIREALAPMADSISSVDADLAELAAAAPPPLLVPPPGMEGDAGWDAGGEEMTDADYEAASFADDLGTGSAEAGGAGDAQGGDETGSESGPGAS